MRQERAGNPEANVLGVYTKQLLNNQQEETPEKGGVCQMETALPVA